MSSNCTYSGQSELPRLPIPSLKETLYRFLEILEPLQSSEQKKETEQIVRKFLQGNGPTLQKLLQEYDKEGIKTGKIHSYVEEFWYDAYLVPDSSVVLNLNPYFLLEV